MRLTALWHLLLATVVGATLAGTAACASGQHPVLRAVGRIPVTDHGYTPPKTAKLKTPLKALEARLEQLGIKVLTLPKERLGTSFGQTDITDPDAITIYMPDDLSVDARFEVLAHEAAHAFQPNGLSRSDYEVFAELVSWELSRHYGHDTTLRVATYLANWKDSVAIAPALQADVIQVRDHLLGKAGATWQ